jgi:F-type H+-transporting ATPase subunit gamma
MKMIASTRLVKAQRAMESARTYGEASSKALELLAPKPAEGAAAGKTLIVACSSDRGLCGAIHSNIAKPLKIKARTEADSLEFVLIGDKVRSQILRSARGSVLLSFNGVGKTVPTFDEAAGIAEAVLASKSSDVNRFQIYYNNFKSVVAYELKIAEVYADTALAASGMIVSVQMCFISRFVR